MDAINLRDHYLLPFVLEDQASSSAFLLVAKAHVYGNCPSPPQQIDLIWRERSALIGILEALENPKRRLSDHIIGAIAHMANFERDTRPEFKENYNLHVKALRIVVSTRRKWENVCLGASLRDYLEKTGLYNSVFCDEPAVRTADDGEMDAGNVQGHTS